MQEKEQKISPFKQRILHFIDNEGISKRAFYASTGISRGTLENISSLTEDSMSKFLATYENINADWFLYGKGSIYKIDNNTAVNEKNIANEEITEYNTKTPRVSTDNILEYLREKDRQLFEHAKKIGELEQKLQHLKKNPSCIKDVNIPE
ncbi:MAG: hypothetical protein PF489_02585 [Salinivirgaceae bacterium]|nr:hypothetical protein [Salinivirgaceae bacterium]